MRSVMNHHSASPNPSSRHDIGAKASRRSARRKSAAIAVPVVMGIGLALAPAIASAANLYTSPGKINIPGPGPASPYPSGISVQGEPGVVTDVVVGLRGITHKAPDDLDVLLVSPEGTASVVASDACAGTPLVSANWFLAEGFPALGAPCRGVYGPTNVISGPDTWPGAPGSHLTGLDRFIGERPNGTWALRVVDDGAKYGGEIAQGWSLAIETATPEAVVPGQADPRAAAPYPLSRVVSGLDGVITDVNVAAPRVYHERAEDLQMLLVGPQGQAVVLMANVCGNARVKNVSWGWDDEAPGPMVRGGTCPTGATYKPQGYDPLAFPAPAPERPYEAPLSSFDYTDPNGEWRLFVSDDTQDTATGFLVQNFALNISTRPRAEVSFTEPTIGVVEGETRQVTLFRTSGGRGLGTGTVTVTATPLEGGPGDLEPTSQQVRFENGQTQATLPIRALPDGIAEGPERYALTIGGPAGDVRPAASATAIVTISDPPGAGDPSPAPAGMPPGAVGPAAAGGPGAMSSGDRTAPRIGRLALTPAAFRAGSGGSTRTRPGTTIRYTVSERASIRLRIARVAGKRPLGVLRRNATAGRNSVRFSGRLSKRPLPRGAYRVRAVAVDAAGNRSVPRVARFRVIG